MPSATYETTLIDRIAPTLRPPKRCVMRQDWHHLLFVHWSVAPEQIRSLLPPGLELDLYNGKAYVGLIPFTLTALRPVWLPPFPPLSNFHEINLRTYVHTAGRDPGIWFFSLDAANAVAVRVARACFKLPYHYARMNLTMKQPDKKIKSEGRMHGQEGVFGQVTLGVSGSAVHSSESPPLVVDYASERLWPRPTPAACVLRYAPKGLAAPAAVGTREHFLVERYILYSYTGRRLYRGRIHHAPYPLQSAEVYSLDETLLAAAGITPEDETPLIHYAKGVRVQFFLPERVE